MARVSDKYQQQLNIDTPYLGVFPDLAAAKSALDAAVRAANQGWINLCSPACRIHALPPFKALAISRVDPDNIDLYSITQDDGQRDPAKRYGIPKSFLDTLKQLRQVQVIDTRRVDDGLVDALWSYSCTVASPDLQGGSVAITKSRTVDLRDGAPDLLKSAGRRQTPGAINAARLNGPQVAESKAQNRAVAEALNVARGMTEPEFYKPWITVSLVPHVPIGLLSQEAIDAAGLAIIGGTAALYGAQRRQSLPPAAPLPQLPQSPQGSHHNDQPADFLGDDEPEPEEGHNSAQVPRGAPPAPSGAPPPPGPHSGSAGASPAQLEYLSATWHRLGADEFQRIASQALGTNSLISGKNLTATQAQILCDTFASGPKGGAPF